MSIPSVHQTTNLGPCDHDDNVDDGVVVVGDDDDDDDENVVAGDNDDGIVFGDDDEQSAKENKGEILFPSHSFFLSVLLKSR